MSQNSIDDLNNMPSNGASDVMLACCGSPSWVAEMCDARPFASASHFHDTADIVFDRLEATDWLAAFAHHPPIGDINSLQAKFAGNRAWSGGEQAGMDGADERTLHALAAGNAAYIKRFGFLFIVCASGKSADEMLQMLQNRLPNEPEMELPVAAREQRAITHLRIDKWLNA